MKKPLRSSIHIAACALALLFFATAADAASGPPATIDYQGTVLDGNGAPLAPEAPANFEVEFRIYDAPTGGTVIWAEKQLVTVLAGKFSVRLGEGQPIVGTGGAPEGSVGHASPGLPGVFADSSRHLGVTVKVPGQTAGEITPRLAFLASPFAYVAAAAGNLVQAPGTQSNLTIGSIAYSTQTLSSTGAISGNSRTVLVDSTSGTPASPITATLPQNAAQKELLIAKTDATTNQVVVAPPTGGTINGGSASIRLKVKGESLTLQNIGGNNWWVVNDNRDKTPVGTIISFGGGGTPPLGYIACEGASLLRTDHPDLYAAIGTQWGATDGTRFNVPKLNGRFLRGIDTDGATDDEADNRFNLQPGGAIARNVGSFQNEAGKAHNHDLSQVFTTNVGAHGHASDSNDGIVTGALNGPNTFWLPQDKPTTGHNYAGQFSNLQHAPSHSHSLLGPTGSTGGNETRPDNAYVRFCVKY